MASFVVKNFVKSKLLFTGFTAQSRAVLPKRPLTIYSDAGGINSKPEQVRLGLVKAAVMVFPFLYFGATISKNGAAFLEENDIFVPDDDDD